MSKLYGIFSAALAGGFLALTGCSSGEGQVPPGAVVEITPQLRTWDIVENLDEEGNCKPIPDYYQDNLMTIRVLDEDGRPIGDVDVMVSMALANNTFTGYPWAKLYDDKDGDFIPDDDELVSDVGDSLLFTRTDKHTGHKTLIIRVNLSCAHGSILHVVAEGASAEANIKVTAKQE